MACRLLTSVLDRSAVTSVVQTFATRIIDALLFALGSAISLVFSLTMSTLFVGSASIDCPAHPCLSIISAATESSLVSTSHRLFRALGTMMPRRPSVLRTERMKASFVLVRSLRAIRMTRSPSRNPQRNSLPSSASTYRVALRADQTVWRGRPCWSVPSFCFNLDSSIRFAGRDLVSRPRRGAASARASSFLPSESSRRRSLWLGTATKSLGICPPVLVHLHNAMAVRLILDTVKSTF